MNEAAVAATGPRVRPSTSFVRFAEGEVEQSIATRFEQQVRRERHRLAIKTRRRALSYAALNEMANRVARAILEAGAGRGERVALLLEHDAPFIAALFGVLKTGNAYVPLDTRSPRPRLMYLLEDSEASLVLTDDGNHALATALAARGQRVLNVDALGADLSGDDLGLSVAPDTVANITYTSGSTGEPKGAVQTHRGALHATLRRTNNLQICCDDRSLLLSPLSFSAARHVIFAALLNGATLLPFNLKEEGLRSLAEFFIHEEVTVLDWMPTGFRHFARSLSGQEAFPKLRLIALSSEPVSAGDVELYKRHFPPDCDFVNMLAATETGPTRMYVLDRNAQLAGSKVPAGYAVEDVEVLLLDEAGAPVGPGQSGEIAFRSRYFATGYWRKPELTAATFGCVPGVGDERVYRSGDVGRLGADGCLEVLGRKDAMVKIRGYRVEPTEVELALLALPTVREAAVVARADAAHEPKLVAYVVAAEGAGAADPAALRDVLQKSLPEYMLPAAFVWVAALPRTANGKVDRRALPAPELTRPEAGHAHVAPRGEAEVRLVGLWEELLGVRSIGVRDDFFALGGHSLLAARLVARIEQTFGRRLPPSVLLEGRTIERLAALLAQADPPTLSPLVAIQRGGSRLPFFCVHPLFGDVLLYEPLARLLGPDQPFYGLRAVQPPTAPEALLPPIRAMATDYIRAIRSVQADGPFLLGGYSLGGVVAFEMACQLRAAGHEVGLVAVIDSTIPAPYLTASEPSVERAVKLIQEVGNLWQVSDSDRERAVAHYRMLRDYRPPKYPGRIVVFQTQEQSFSLLGPRGAETQERWAQLAGGGLEVRTVPGDHWTLFGEPHIRVLAAALENCLEQAAASVRHREPERG